MHTQYILCTDMLINSTLLHSNPTLLVIGLDFCTHAIACNRHMLPSSSQLCHGIIIYMFIFTCHTCLLKNDAAIYMPEICGKKKTTLTPLLEGYWHHPISHIRLSITLKNQATVWDVFWVSTHCQVLRQGHVSFLMGNLAVRHDKCASKL